MIDAILTPAQRAATTAEITALQRKVGDIMRQQRGPIPPAKAVRMMTRIDELRRAIALSDKEQVRAFKVNAVPREAILEIIAIPLLADVLNDFIAGVNATLRNYGLPDSVYADYAHKIQSLSLKLVDVLYESQTELSALIDYDDYLVGSIAKRIRSFLDSRLPKIIPSPKDQK